MKWPPCIGITCVSCGASAHQGCRMNWPPPDPATRINHQWFDRGQQVLIYNLWGGTEPDPPKGHR